MQKSTAEQRVKEDVAFFNALGESTRFQIFKKLITDDLCITGLSKYFKITPSAVSQHCKILELSGLAVKERVGQTVCYKPDMSNIKVKTLVKFISQ